MSRLLLIVGGSGAERRRAAEARLAREGWAGEVVALSAATLPFAGAPFDATSGGPRAIVVHEVERAFPGCQTAGARLVLTQSTFLVQTLVDRLRAVDCLILTADRPALERAAPEAFQRRGPWAGFEVVDLDRTGVLDLDEQSGAPASLVSPALDGPHDRALDLLARAYLAPSADERVQLCRDATLVAPQSAAAALALASALREQQDMAAAREALDEAARLAPDSAAVHFEDGKFWLACDDMERARDAFARAAGLMPTFSAAFSNLGATLGELDEPDAALAAFTRALATDPDSVALVNNIGVVNRELGRLEASEAAFRRVIGLAPDFVFGHYNLGHTLFLAGRYGEALAEYEEGQRRDPEQNRRQACRLAVARFAAGDAAGAERDLWRAADAAPPEEREDLLLEAYEILSALVARHPALAAGAGLVARVGAALTGTEDGRP